MVKRRLILADNDERYLKEISSEFREKLFQLDLLTFTTSEKLKAYLAEEGKGNVMVVGEVFVDEELMELSEHLFLKIMLSISGEKPEGFTTVKKYQRIDQLISEVLVEYAQASKSAELAKGENATKIVTFYSPAGGTGTTSLALTFSAMAAKTGLRVFYLNLEEVDSLHMILPQTSITLSDVFLALKTKGGQAGLKLKSGVVQELNSGYYYISGVESISEHLEIDASDIGRLLTEIREIASCNVLVLDVSSGFTKKTVEIMNRSDLVLVPMYSDENSINKMERFLGEADLHSEYENIFGKMNIIWNKAQNDEARQVFSDKVKSFIPVITSIPVLPQLEKLKNIIQADVSLIPLFLPIIERVGGES